MAGSGVQARTLCWRFPAQGIIGLDKRMDEKSARFRAGLRNRVDKVCDRDGREVDETDRLPRRLQHGGCCGAASIL